MKVKRKMTKALPLGNGHMGAMCYGGADGRYDLSENTCWSGKDEEHPLRENAKRSMEKARKLLLQEIIQKARFCWKTVQEKRSIMVHRFRWGD